MAAAITVEDAALGLRPEGNGHLQGPDRQITLHPIAHGPADDTTGVQVQDNCQIQPALAGPDVADIARSFLVRPDRTEVAIQQVRGDAQRMITCRCRRKNDPPDRFLNRRTTQTHRLAPPDVD